MIELALVVATAFPRGWANDYCIYRVLNGGMTHEEAVIAATETKGPVTDEALEFTATNQWCLGIEES